MTSSNETNFCTKCGTHLGSGWQFCSKCGSEVIAEQPSIVVEDEVPVEKSDEDEIDELQGVPESVITGSETNRAAKKSSPIFAIFAWSILIFMTIGVCAVVISSIANRPCATKPKLRASDSRCLSQEEMAAKQEAKKQRESEEAKKAQEDERQAERNNFLDRLNSYRDHGCKPVYKDERDSYGLGLLFMDSDGSWKDFERLRNESSNPDDPLYSGDWGNEVDKVLMMSAAYESRIADIYEDIQIFDARNELGKYRATMKKYLSMTGQISRRLCKAIEPSAADKKFAASSREKLTNDGTKFDSWATLVAGEAESLSYELEQSTKPQCTEVSTNNPNYNIVKCTNLP